MYILKKYINVYQMIKQLQHCIILVIIVLMGLFSGESAYASADPFPVYPSLVPNMAFWENVYSRYHTGQGILHDNRDLYIIYDVIALVNPGRSGARKINEARIEKAKKKYERILEALARGQIPKTAEEKRVTNLFGSKATRSGFRKASRNIRCQVGQKDRFQKGIIRSGAYLKKIKQIFRRYGLPLDLAYLPHVESSFNLTAYSKFGAAGMWQFTRSTGKRFMTVDYTIDERRDPILSSEAAARLLIENYKKLGSWPLALTAYNHGANGMARAKRTKGNYERIFKEYNGHRFRFASRNFYSEFLAARNVAKNYQKYFGPLRLDTPEETTVSVLPGYVALKDLVELIKTDTEDIRRLNPALREPVFRGDKYIPKGYHLLLAKGKAKIAALAMSEIPERMFKHRQKRSRFYKVEKGDTAGKIARMHGIRLRDLMEANNLNSRARIYAGQNLRLPAPGKTGTTLAKMVPKKRKLVAGIDSEPKKPIPKVEALPSAPESPGNPKLVIGDLNIKQVTTRKGKRIGIILVAVEETLGHYADWLQVSAREIRRVNGFRYGKVLHIHQRIRIPLEKVSKELFEEKRFEYHEEIVQDFFGAYRVSQIQIYQIKNGDNICNLCNDVFEIPVWLFQTYNVGLNLNDLKAAQPVKIPVIEEVASS